jgi:predicted DNA-binding transcriptional regulator AlpA
MTKHSIQPHPISIFESLPSDAYVNIESVKALFGCSSATVWREVKRGHIPKPYKLAMRTTRWNVGELRQALRNASGKGE